jgi:hypothetical protein
MFTQTKWFLPGTGKSTKGGSPPTNQEEAKDENSQSIEIPDTLQIGQFETGRSLLHVNAGQHPSLNSSFHFQPASASSFAKENHEIITSRADRDRASPCSSRPPR